MELIYPSISAVRQVDVTVAVCLAANLNSSQAREGRQVLEQRGNMSYLYDVRNEGEGGGGPKCGDADVPAYSDTPLTVTL